MAPLTPSVPRGGRTRGAAEQGPLQGLYPRGPRATASLSDVTRVSLRKCPAVPRRWSGGHALHWRLAVRNHLKTRGDCQLTSDGGSFPRELIPSGGGKSGREGGGWTGPPAHAEGPATHTRTGTHTCKHLHTHACTAHPSTALPAHTTGFCSDDILEKAKLQGQRRDQGSRGLGDRRELGRWGTVVTVIQSHAFVTPSASTACTSCLNFFKL